MVLIRVLLLLVLTLAACSPERDAGELFAPGGEGIPVVDAVLIVAHEFPDVYVTRTLRPDETFTLDRAAIRGATVFISTTGGDTVSYYEDTLPGRYRPIPPFPGMMVEQLATYRLTVTLIDGRTLTATTTTPAQIQVTEWVLLDNAGSSVTQRLSTFEDYAADSLYTRPENQLQYAEGLLEVRLLRAPAIAYQLGLASLDLASPLLADADFLDEEDLEDLFTRSTYSPPFAGGDTTFRVPWLAMYYAGRYKVRVFAMDRNWYDLARTDPVLGAGGFGFGGEAGDGFPRPIFHVNGGIGLFGSMSVDSVGIYINPPN